MRRIQAGGHQWLAAVAIWAAAATAVAQPAPSLSPAKDLREAVETAASLSSEAASGPALHEEAEALRRLGRGPFSGPPTLSAYSIPGPNGILEEEATLSAGLRWPGESRAVSVYAGSLDAAARTALSAARLRLAGEVRDAWWALAKARAMVVVEREQARLASASAAEVERLVTTGEQARRDLLLAQGEAAATQARFSEAEGELSRAEAAYEALAGPPPAEFAPEAPAAPTDLEDDPALRAVLGRAAVAEARARTRTYAARPRFEGTLGVRRARDDGATTTKGVTPYVNAVTAGFKIPLGRDQAVVAEEAAARSEALAAAAETNRLRIRLTAQRHAAQAGLEAARRSVAQWQANRDGLAASLELAERGRREGELGYIEVLRARQSLSEADRELASARVASLAAISSYNQALGVLP